MTRDIYNQEHVSTTADAIEYFSKDNFTRLNQPRMQNEAEIMAVKVLQQYQEIKDCLESLSQFDPYNEVVEKLKNIVRE